MGARCTSWILRIFGTASPCREAGQALGDGDVLFSLPGWGVVWEEIFWSQDIHSHIINNTKCHNQTSKKKHHIHHIPTVFSPFDSFKPLKKQTTHKKWGRFSLSPQPLQMWKNRRLQRGEGCSSSGRCCDVHGRAVWRGQSSLTKCGQMWGSKSNVGMGICSQIPLVYLVGPFFTR